MSIDFYNKVVWIVGGGSGIGADIADTFAQKGAIVYALDKQFDSNKNYICEVIDITNQEKLKKIVKKLLLKNSCIDVYINAAGILKIGDLDQLNEKDFDLMYQVNVLGAFQIMKYLSPVFKAQRKGKIIHIASNAGNIPRVGMLGYCVTKAALLSLSRCIALELAPYGVHCNAVSPGSTETPMLQSLIPGNVLERSEQLIKGAAEIYKLGIPLKKIATPNDITNVVLFLASDMSSHICMQNIIVDGGATLGV